MNPDVRFYLVLYNYEKKTSDIEIFNGTENLTKKSRKKSPSTQIYAASYPIDEAYIDTTWYFCNNPVAHATLQYEGIRRALFYLTNNSELILRGHGNLRGQRLSRVSAEVLARGLLKLGLKANCRINITACNLGRNETIGGTDRATASADDLGSNSFADVFLRTLVDEGGLRPVVHARTSQVKVKANGSKTTRLFDDDGLDAADATHVHKQSHGKIILSVDGGGGIIRRFAY